MEGEARDGVTIANKWLKSGMHTQSKSFDAYLSPDVNHRANPINQGLSYMSPGNRWCELDQSATGLKSVILSQACPPRCHTPAILYDHLKAAETSRLPMLKFAVWEMIQNQSATLLVETLKKSPVEYVRICLERSLNGWKQKGKIPIDLSKPNKTIGQVPK